VTQLRDELQSALGATHRIERELGGGGMSRVFIAEELAFGRKVVVKVLPPDMAAAVSIERFRREISLAARLQHPHVVPLLSAGQTGNISYFMMPFVEGESLRLKLAQGGELPVADGVRILREIASALDYAHEKGVVHRDIKPDNVLLSRGSAMVTDFGVAKALSESTNADRGSMTSLGVAVGTPAYMSPEQAAASETIDARADIYSLGVLAYELFAGRPPYSGRSPQATLAAHVSEPAEAISHLRPSLPPALANMIMRCLEKRPADRPQTAGEVVHLLDGITTPSGGSQPTGHTSAVSGHRQPAKKSKVVALAGIAVIVATGLTLTLLPRNRAASDTSADSRTIAVLPFENVGGDPANEYFGAGMADALTSALSKVPELNVRAARSVPANKGQPVDLTEIGRALGVFAVVDGKAQRAGDRLRLTAALTRVSDGTVLWSDTYTKEIKDVFAVQDEVARAVAVALQAKFGNVSASLVTAPTADLAAYDDYLKGRFLWNQRTKASITAAIGHFKAAIKRDPKFALGYVGLADAYTVYPQYAESRQSETHGLAIAAAQQALQLDSLNAEAYAVLGLLNAQVYRWERADSAFRKAIAVRPQYATAHHWYGLSLTWRGDREASLAELTKAVELDPTSRIIATAAAIPAGALDIEQGIARLEKVLLLDPGFPEARRRLARLLAVKGHFARAESEVRGVIAVSGLPESGDIGYVLGASGRHAEAQRIAEDLIAKGARQYVVAGTIAMIYLGLGDKDKTFHWLEKAIGDFDAPVKYVAIDPIWQPIRSDPRYAALASRMNIR
jgi:serine/threonine-protein kinase